MSIQPDKSGEQKDAESNVEGFRDHLGPFVVAAETTRMPMVFCNAQAADKPIVFVNQAFLDLTGYGEQEVLGQKFDFLIQSGTDPEALTEIQTAFEGGRDLETPVRFYRKDGSTVWVSIFINPVRDDTGTVVQHFASFVDITRREQEHERLRVLLDRLNHCTQNTLATVLAIAEQTLRGMADEQALDAFQGRILALSKTHRLLGALNWGKAGLRDILIQTVGPLGSGGRVRFEGDEIALQPAQALTLALAFHELAGNALAHGAMSTPSAGKVEVSWQIEADPQRTQIRLRWLESGGPPVNPPSFRGFGRRLIEGSLGRDLGGEVRLAFKATGVLCEIILPIARESGG